MCAALKKTEEPSSIGAYFYGFLVALLGVLIGGLYLASFPANSLASSLELKQFLEEHGGDLSRPGATYRMNGPTLRSKAWEAKRQAILDGRPGSIELTHNEINAWLESKFRPAAAPSKEEQPKVLIMPGVPNVYIQSDRVYVSLPTDVLFYGSELEYTVFATGTIDPRNGSSKFSMNTLNVNCAAVPFVNVLGKQITNTLLKAYSGSEEFIAMQDAWARVESVEQSEGKLLLKLR